MANTNAQIIKLNKASRASFETDTAGITDPALLPIMGMIDESPAVMGAKFPDLRYEYWPILTDEVTDLQTDVASNTSAITNLTQLISNISGTFESMNSGETVAPYGTPVEPPAYVDKEIPQLFVRFAGFSDYKVKRVHLTTAYLQTYRTGATRLTVSDAGGGNVQIDIENGDEGGYTTVATGTLAEDTPGILLLADASDSEVLYGFVETMSLGLSTASLGSTLIEANGTPYSESASVVGFGGDGTTIGGLEWDFEVNSKANWSSSDGIVGKLTLGGIELFNHTFTTIASTAGDKYVTLRFKVQFIGCSNADNFNMRTFCEVLSPAGTAVFSETLIDPQEVQMGSMAVSSASDAGTVPMYFGLTFQTITDSSTMSIQMLSSKMKKTAIYTP